VSRVRVGPGERVLDVATGTGMVAREVVARTGASVVGLDQSQEMLRRGVVETKATDPGAPVRFVLGRAEVLPFASSHFDAVTFTYLLRYVDDPAATLAELVRVLKPAGTLANLEFHVPSGLLWRRLWWLYTRVGLPAAGRLSSSAWYEAGRFLGPSISRFYAKHPLDEQLAQWRAAGITDVRARVMSLGGGVVIWGRNSG